MPYKFHQLQSIKMNAFLVLMRLVSVSQKMAITCKFYSHYPQNFGIAHQNNFFPYQRIQMLQRICLRVFEYQYR